MPQDANANSNVTRDGQAMRPDPLGNLRAEFEDRLGEERQLRYALERQLTAAQKTLARYRRTPEQVIAQNAESICQRAGEIANKLSWGEIDPEQGKTALYALQVALSAIRTQDTAKAARQKEERLRKTANETRPSRRATRRHASPKPKAQGKNRQPNKSKSSIANLRRRSPIAQS